MITNLRVDFCLKLYFEDFPYTSQPWDSGWHAVTNPAHETYGEDGVIWSSVALQRQVDNTMESKVRSLVQELDNTKALI